MNTEIHKLLERMRVLRHTLLREHEEEARLGYPCFLPTDARVFLNLFEKLDTLLQIQSQLEGLPSLDEAFASLIGRDPIGIKEDPEIVEIMEKLADTSEHKLMPTVITEDTPLEGEMDSNGPAPKVSLGLPGLTASGEPKVTRKWKLMDLSQNMDEGEWESAMQHCMDIFAYCLKKYNAEYSPKNQGWVISKATVLQQIPGDPDSICD